MLHSAAMMQEFDKSHLKETDSTAQLQQVVYLG